MRFWAYARARGPISIETDITAGVICLPKRSTEFNKNGGPGFVSGLGRMGTHLFVAANMVIWMSPAGLGFVANPSDCSNTRGTFVLASY